MSAFPLQPVSTLRVFVQGIGLLGPGFSSWEEANPQLTGHATYTTQKTQLPAPLSLRLPMNSKDVSEAMLPTAVPANSPST